MFGHDNQNSNQNNGGAVTTPSDDSAQNDQSASNGSPSLSAPVASDDGLGGFLPSDHEPGNPAATGSDDLLDIKQQALQALTPLVGHLQQSPEEKFRTTMMMIQASDDHSLIKVAYESAKEIADEKERAQALLDIVNEINYFTQHHPAA